MDRNISCQDNWPVVLAPNPADLEAEQLINGLLVAGLMVLGPGHRGHI